MTFRAAALLVVLSGPTLAQTAPAPITPAPAPAPAGQWRMTAHAMGKVYETGTFDRPIDGGLRLACMSDGGALLTVQIKGAGPAAGSRFLLIPETRKGRSQTFTFTADGEGQVKVARARGDRQFMRLWTALRGGNNATIRYADGSFAVQSLVGARTTLPARTCG